MAYRYDPATDSFTIVQDEITTESCSPYDWNKINSSTNGSGITHYTTAERIGDILSSGVIKVSFGKSEAVGVLKPAVWLTASDFAFSSIAGRQNGRVPFCVGTMTISDLVSSMNVRFNTCIHKQQHSYTPVKFEICQDSIDDGSVRLVPWAEYKKDGFCDGRVAKHWSEMDVMGGANPKTFYFSYEGIPLHCFIEPKILIESEWVSLNEAGITQN